MDGKSLPNRIKSYLVVYIKTTAGVFRLLMVLMLMVVSACTENKTINQSPPVTSQAGPDTRTDSDWGGGGTGDGGGGQGVECSAEVKEPGLKNRLLVRDVFEAKYNYQLKMTDEGLGPAGTDTIDDAAYKVLAKNIFRYFGPAMFHEEFKGVGFWKEFVKTISDVPDDVKLRPSQDANSPLVLPKGCRLVQIAYWSEPSGASEKGVLFVDRKSWRQLDQFNKVALLAHEYFFKVARTAGAKNSDYTRKKIGQLLSVEGLPPLFSDWAPSKDPQIAGLLPESSKGFKYCQGLNDGAADLVRFYQYQDKNERQVLLFTDIRIGEKQMPPFEKASVVVSKGDASYASIAAASDVLFENPAMENVRETDKIGVSMVDDNGLNALGKEMASWGPELKGAPFSTFAEKGMVALGNPYYGYIPVDERDAVSTEKLINLLTTKTVEVIHDNPANKKIEDKTIFEALMQLNSDIDEAAKGGGYPANFPKWTAAIQKLESAGMILDKDEKEGLYIHIPHYMSLFRTGYYNNQDVRAIIGPKGFVKTSNASSPELKGASVVVFFGGAKTAYVVACYSYDQLYKQLTGKDAPAR